MAALFCFLIVHFMARGSFPPSAGAASRIADAMIGSGLEVESRRVLSYNRRSRLEQLLCGGSFVLLTDIIQQLITDILMNIGELHPKQKEISLVPFFDCQGTVSAMQILASKTLKKHITKTPALLVCVTGRVVFKNEKGIEQSLSPGDYVEIEPMVQHWVDGIEDSNLLLIK
jgi:hypothetical protein